MKVQRFFPERLAFLALRATEPVGETRRLEAAGREGALRLPSRRP